MSRFGNPFAPAALDAPDVVHAWAIIDHASGAMRLFHQLEAELEAAADARGEVLVSSPSYETFRPSDPGIPAHVVIPLPSWVQGDGLVAIVHAYAVTRVRSGRRVLVAALPVGTPEAAPGADGSRP